jgi:hypothetical protein
MDISLIHFHDTRIVKVIEDPETDTITMEVIYPVDWGNNIFEKRRLVFDDVINYHVTEIPFQGSPTILDGKIISEDGRRTRIRLETNAGQRELSCAAVRLIQ